MIMGQNVVGVLAISRFKSAGGVSTDRQVRILGNRQRANRHRHSRTRAL